LDKAYPLILVHLANAAGSTLPQDAAPMSTDIIVSYDGSPNDDDGLALGKLLAEAGLTIALAYVRHSHEFDPRREELASHDAQRRLEHGASWLGQPDLKLHVVVNASTGEGLAQLAESEGASLMVFGSDYRTPPGRAEPGTTAQFLLEGGPVAVGVALAGLRTSTDAAITSISFTSPDADDAAERTARALGERLGARIVGDGGGPADLIVVGSQPGGVAGRVLVGGATRSMLNAAQGSVLVVPRGVPALS
jgi:nucleotide-binding universal stress UspA family protein